MHVRTALEHLLFPVGIERRPVVGAIALVLGDVGGVETDALPGVQGRDIHILHVLGTGNGRRHFSRGSDGVITRIGELGHLALATFGSNEDDAVRGTRTVDGGRSVFEDRDALHGVHVNLIEITLNAVDQHEGTGPGVEGTDTADGDLAAVGAGTSRSLHDADTGHQALESRRQVGSVTLDDVLSGDRRNGAGESHLLLNLISDHDDIVYFLILGFEGDVELGPVVHRHGTAVVADRADGQRNRPGRQRKGVGAIHAGSRRNHRLRSLDHDRRTDHGLSVGGDDLTRQGQLIGGRFRRGLRLQRHATDQQHD